MRSQQTYGRSSRGKNFVNIPAYVGQFVSKSCLGHWRKSKLEIRAFVSTSSRLGTLKQVGEIVESSHTVSM